METVIDDEKHAQVKLYNKYFSEKIKKYEWTIICDLDEFIYSRKEFKTIKDYLNTVNKEVSQIAINWKIFGSNGFNTLDKKEPDSVIDSFTKRINYNKKKDFQGVSKINGDIKMNSCKCIIRNSKVLKLHIHSSNINSGLTTDSNNNQIIKHLPFIPCNENILNSQNLHLNHYTIRSLDWFTRVKMKRGSAANQTNTNIKSRINYFKNLI